MPKLFKLGLEASNFGLEFSKLLLRPIKHGLGVLGASKLGPGASKIGLVLGDTKLGSAISKLE